LQPQPHPSLSCLTCNCVFYMQCQICS